MTKTHKAHARQYSVNAHDCPFIGQCSCCERIDLETKPGASPVQAPGPARMAGKRPVRVHPGRKLPKVTA